MARYPVILPPASLAALFTSRTQPMLDLINCNIRQSRALIALRDALLPKLLSGEMRVGEAARAVAG
jgi:type I restriction enzyme S subunit